MGSARDDTAVRSTLGSYRLFREVAHDPLGGSYLACPAGARSFPNWAVVRRMHTGIARDPGMVHAFLAATQAAVRMVHKNVASTFDFGGKMTLPWVAREHLYGVSVIELIARAATEKTKVPWNVAVYLVAEAADGIAAVRARLPAHGPPVGFLTGAVAPSIFLTRSGEVKIVDGCLPLIDGLPLIDSEALPYKPREPVAAGRNAERVDAFGLGVILWELVAGRRLFAGRDDDETNRLLDAKVVPALRATARSPHVIDDIILRAVGKGPELGPRLESATDVGQELRAALAVEGRRVDREAVAAVVRDLFADKLAEQERAIAEAWKQEQEFQQRGDVPGDVLSDSAITLPVVGETARDVTTETEIAPRSRGRARIEDGFDEVPTVPRSQNHVPGPPSWRAQPPVMPSLIVAPPRIDFMPESTRTPDQPPSSVPLPLSRVRAPAPKVEPIAPPDGLVQLDDDELDDEELEAEVDPDGDAATHEKLSYEPAVIIEPGPPSQPRARFATIDPLPMPPVENGPGSGFQRAAAERGFDRGRTDGRVQQARQTSVLVTGAVCFSVSLLGILAVAISRSDSNPRSAASTSVNDSFHAASPAPTTAPPARPVRPQNDPWTSLPPAPVPVVSPNDLPRVTAPSPSPAPTPPAPRTARAWTPPAPPAVSGPTGLLTVFCSPACDRVIDGSRSLGPSPVFKVPASVGSHRLRLHVDGTSPDKEVTVTVTEGDTTVVRESVGQ